MWDLGIFYSRQENAFANLTSDDFDAMGVSDESRDIKIRPLAQTFAAVQGEVDRMARLADLFESQKLYDETFRESYLRANTRRIVLAYKVHFMLGSVIRHMEELKPDYMAPIVRSGRNLIGALLVQGLFNDSLLPSYSEDYGRSLVKEAVFREQLKTLGANKLFPVLKTVVNSPDYKERMKQGNYSFLRTKDCFQRCMGEAKKRWDWDKKSL